MIRPCFLVVDREFAGSISSRKLVIETAKFNVITVYSGAEAIETMKRFPAVHGVVVDAGIKDMPCAELVKALRQIQPKTPIVAIGAPFAGYCNGVDHHLEAFDPPKLVNLLRELAPTEAEMIKKHEQELSREQ